MTLSFRFILLVSMLSTYERAFDAYDFHEVRESRKAMELGDYIRARCVSIGIL